MAETGLHTATRPAQDGRVDRVVNGTRLVAVQGDLTQQDVGAIVNAANEYLQHGGGVAAAIVRAGGHEIQRESDEWVSRNGPVRRGSAAVTTAGSLPASRVVHVVGPRYREGRDNAGLLREAVHAALDTAEANTLSSIALPAISAGIFGYPPDEAAEVIVDATRAWAEADSRHVKEVRFVAFDAEMAGRFERALS